MPYSKQTFTFRQIFTFSHANQIEENIAAHIHGQDGVTSEMYLAEFDLNQSGAGVIFKHTGLANVPRFKMATIQVGGDVSPTIRWYYVDDVTAERTILDFDDKGIVASVRAPAVGRGTHFAGWIDGDTYPVFRLNSSPDMTLELGPGGTTDTDVWIRRAGTGILKIFTQGIERLLISPTQFAISNIDEVALKEAVDLVLSSGIGEQAIRFKRTDLTNAPVFKLGRVDELSGVARWRLLYQDDVLAERLLFRLDRDGLVEIFRQAVGPHFDCYRIDDANPFIRLTSAGGAGEVQMGPGGATSPDVNLVRKGAGVLGTDHRLEASLGLTTKALSGAPADAPPDATMYLDSVNHRLYVRSGGAWRYTQLT